MPAVAAVISQILPALFDRQGAVISPRKLCIPESGVFGADPRRRRRHLLAKNDGYAADIFQSFAFRFSVLVILLYYLLMKNYRNAVSRDIVKKKVDL
jgi:hypothetical protein